jgi:hypothetical protein
VVGSFSTNTEGIQDIDVSNWVSREFVDFDQVDDRLLAEHVKPEILSLKFVCLFEWFNVRQHT